MPKHNTFYFISYSSLIKYNRVYRSPIFSIFFPSHEVNNILFTILLSFDVPFRGCAHIDATYTIALADTGYVASIWALPVTAS